jgi:TPR repeat protein
MQPHTRLSKPARSCIALCCAGLLVFDVAIAGTPAQISEAESLNLVREALNRNDASVQRLQRGADAGNAWAMHGLCVLAEARKAKEDAMRWCAAAAESGLAAGRYRLASFYLAGEFTPRDDAKAFALFSQAAEQNDADAQMFLAAMYKDGRGTARDDGRAADWFRRAAQQSKPGAAMALGMIYADRASPIHDDAEAIRWFHRAAASNAPGALPASLAVIVGDCAEPADQMLACLRTKAEAGEARAQFALGIKLGREAGVRREEPTEWLRKAADQGFAPAQTELAGRYLQGSGVPRDASEAAKWLSRAAEAGDAMAQGYLAQMYREGEGVRRDAGSQARFERAAAEQGQVSAQFDLGLLYVSGRGVEKSDAEAVKWFRLAASGGFVSAMHSLGLMFHDGNGVKRDYEEALRWYSLAAMKGHAKAQSQMRVVEPLARAARVD